MKRIPTGITLAVAAALLVFAAPSRAQDDAVDVTKLPGYFDFGDIDQFSDGEEVVEIDLTQPLLGLFAGIVDEEEPDLGQLLRHLELVNVRVFSYRVREEDALREHMEELSETLRGRNWENIVRVRGDEENVNIFVLLSNGERGRPANEDTAIEGLAALVLDDYQAVFVNVVGHFGMDEISRIGSHFNIPHFDDMDDDRRGRRDRRRHRNDRDRDDHDDEG